MNGGVIAGLAVLIGSEAATLAGLEPFAHWNTPIGWTGFILFADSSVFAARGQSWIRSSPTEFTLLAVVSIPMWLVFEFYNQFIENWYYVGLPTNLALRLLGYAWSFATIWPAIFEGADLVGVWRGGPQSKCPPVPEVKPSTNFDPQARLFVVLGSFMLVWPLIWPSPYLAAPVWLGFIFLLDPLNAHLGGASLFTEWRRGQHGRWINLALSGLLCGLLWEFLNYWALAKWHYTVPILENVKLFEMPLPGYLGFPAFALECFTLYEFLRRLFRLRTQRSIAL